MALAPNQRLQNGRYEIIKKLGEGGMGAVYLAVDHNIDRGHLVALKENTNTSEYNEGMFQREARMLARLRHPNLPRVTDHFIDFTDNQSTANQYLVMDYVEGQDLSEILHHQGAFSEAEALIIIEQVTAALEYMHNWIETGSEKSNPIIHRDIKPSNIRQTPTGEIRLVDFGLARFEAGGMTRMQLNPFTPGFSPVEQYTGNTSTRSDIYALGATLYTLLTGKVPPEAPEIASGSKTLVPLRQLDQSISRNTEHVVQRAMKGSGGRALPQRKRDANRFISTPKIPTGSPHAHAADRNNAYQHHLSVGCNGWISTNARRASKSGSAHARHSPSRRGCCNAN